VLKAVADRAVAEAEVLGRAGVDEVRVDTDGRGVDDLADEVLRVTRLDERSR